MDRLADKIIQKAWAQMAHSEREQRECQIHGAYTSLLIRGTWSGCVECAKAADVVANNVRLEQWSIELKQRALAEMLGRAAIPPRFAGSTLDTYEATNEGQQRALRIARKYADGFESAKETGANLIFCGTTGTGKTHLAIGIAHEIMARGHSACFTSAYQAALAVRESYKREGKTEAQITREFVMVDLLIMDEAGVTNGKDFDKNIMLQIINGRYEMGRPTILTSNLALDALKEAIGERPFDRLRHGGTMAIFEWKTYRSRWAT